MTTTNTIPAGAFTLCDSFALNEFISEQQPNLQQCLQFVEDRGVEMKPAVIEQVEDILEFANHTPQHQESDTTEVVTVRTAAAKVTCFITALDEVVDADAISDVRLDQTLNELAGTLEGALRASRLQSGGTQFTMKMQRGVLDLFITALKHALGLPSVVEMENKFDLGMLLGVLQIAAMS